MTTVSALNLRMRCSAFAVHRAWKARRLSRQGWILGRVACLGHDTLQLLGLTDRVLNYQKARVDYWLHVSRRPDQRVRPAQVAGFLKRQDTAALIAQQGDLAWRKIRPPVALVMDSYAELTDQLFVERGAGWRFCTNYADLEHSESFDRRFETVGLMPTADILTSYHDYFSMIRGRFGRIPILFMHFPSILDTRPKFREREQCIADAIRELAPAFQPFYPLAVDDAVVDWPEHPVPGQEKFPYHFNHTTYLRFAESVRQTGALSGLEAHTN